MMGLPNSTQATPEFGDFSSMQSQIVEPLTENSTNLDHADIVYWTKHVSHAMYVGRRFQFAAWDDLLVLGKALSSRMI